MGIQVVRFRHQSRRAPTTDGAPGPATLLFDPRLERGAERTIGDRYRRLEAGPRSADLVIIRGSDTDLTELVDNDSMLAEIREGKPTMVLAPESTGAAPTLQPVGWSAPVPDHPTPEELREAEILCGLHAEQAIYRHGGVHYLLPNAVYHAEAFVRLGDSLNDQIDLFRLSDWLIERIEPGTALLADNGSMLALLTTVALRVQQSRGYSPRIATLDEYPVAPSAIADTVDRLRLGSEGRLLFAISVNSSGRVAREVAALHGVATEVVILCETAGEPEGDFERFSRLPLDRWEVDSHGRCGRCPELHLLAVSPRSYELRTAIRLKPEGLHIPDAIACKGFWEAAQDADAIRLHVDAGLARGSAKPTRHLAVEIDVAKLLAKSETFRARCLEKLTRVAAPDLVLIPEHRASEELGRLVRAAYPDLDPDRVVTVAVGSETPDLCPLLEGVDHVLIVDDALVSGNTVVGLRRQVHRDSVELGGVAVTIFIPLSRPADQEDHHRVWVSVHPSRELETGKTIGGLHCAQELLLPDGGECPWCRELAMLEQHLEELEGPVREFVVGRREQLSSGALSKPLLPCGGEEEGTIVGSFFGDLEPIAAVAAVSAHAQRLHDQMERLREDETIKVLDVPLILQAFFDPLIVATMLRTLFPRDLRDPPSEHVVARTIRANLRDYPAATIAELALASLEGKLPVKPVRELLEANDGAWAKAYLALLEGY
jgi:hypothetical protein